MFVVVMNYNNVFMSCSLQLTDYVPLHLFFFSSRRRHTRLVSDWSSDVCSSDLIAEKGGEALFHKHAGDRAPAIRNWVVKNGFGGMLIAALLPPPTPFKVFVVAAGVFEVPLTSFMSAVALARVVRYFGIGYLAIRYGREAMPYLVQHKLAVNVFLIPFGVVSYLLSRVILMHRPSAER